MSALVLPSDSAACSVEKCGTPLSSSAAISPSINMSGNDSASLAIALNLSVQFSPLRVFSATSPSSTRSCTR